MLIEWELLQCYMQSIIMGTLSSLTLADMG